MSGNRKPQRTVAGILYRHVSTIPCRGFRNWFCRCVFWFDIVTKFQLNQLKAGENGVRPTLQHFTLNTSANFQLVHCLHPTREPIFIIKLTNAISPPPPLYRDPIYRHVSRLRLPGWTFVLFHHGKKKSDLPLRCFRYVRGDTKHSNR